MNKIVKPSDVLIERGEFLRGLPKERNLAGLKVVQSWGEVIKQERTGYHFSLPFESEHLKSRYTAETMSRVLKNDRRFWILDPGFSFFEMACIFGCDPNMPPCRDEGNSGWLFDEDSSWTKEVYDPNYYLISMPVLCGSDLDQQETAIMDLGEGRKERASCRLALVLALSHFFVFGNYGFGDCHHLGPETSSLGSTKTNCVVAIRPKGFAFYNFSKGGPPHKNIGACLIEKFDF